MYFLKHLFRGLTGHVQAHAGEARASDLRQRPQPCRQAQRLRGLHANWLCGWSGLRNDALSVLGRIDADQGLV